MRRVFRFQNFTSPSLWAVTRLLLSGAKAAHHVRAVLSLGESKTRACSRSARSNKTTLRPPIETEASQRSSPEKRTTAPPKFMLSCALNSLTKRCCLKSHSRTQPSLEKATLAAPARSVRPAPASGRRFSFFHEPTSQNASRFVAPLG